MLFNIYEKWNDGNAKVNTSVLGAYTSAGKEARAAQMFPVVVPHLLNKLRIRLKRFNANTSPHNVTISIKNTSEGLPTGNDLCSYTFDGTTISKVGWGSWHNIIFDPGANLTAGLYAIVMVAPQFIADSPLFESVWYIGTYYDSSQYQYGQLEAVWQETTEIWGFYNNIKYSIMFEEGCGMHIRDTRNFRNFRQRY